MGLNRTDAKRDRNEPALVSKMEELGGFWQKVTGTAGQPDGVLWVGDKGRRVEIKMPGEALTEAQVDDFIRANQKGVPTWVVRREEDVQPLLDGELDPWEPTIAQYDAWRAAQEKKRKKAQPRGFRPGRDKARSVAEMCAAFGCARSQAPGKPVCDTHAG